ncbi:MAG: sister chromatid cohesion protein PDS5 [Gemmataceae bacterium]
MFVPLAAFVLAFAIDPPAPAELRAALKDESRSVRAKAAVELFRSQGAPVADLLPGLLAGRSDSDPAVRAAADAAWAGIGPGVRASLPFVRRSLAAGADPQGAKKAADGFAKAGLDAVPGLLDALADEKPTQAGAFVSPRLRVTPLARPVSGPSGGASRLTEAVALTFVALGPPAIPTLTEALADDNPVVREVAATVIGRMATPPSPRDARPRELTDALRPTLPALIARFRDPDPGVRQRAAEAVGQIGTATPATVPALAAALAHRDPAVRRAAVTALKGADPTAEPVKPALVAALDDPEPGVRVAAAELLCKLDPPLPAALVTLVAELRTRDNLTRAAAGQVLESVAARAKPAAPALRAMTRDRDPMARVYAGRALARLGGEDAAAGIATLNGLLVDESAGVRVGAAEGLWEAGRVEDAMPSVVAALGSPDGSASGVAAALLQRVPPNGPQTAAVVTALGAALADAPPAARQQLLTVLQRIGTASRPASVSVARLLRAGDDGTRQQAVSTLRMIGVTKEAVPDLVEGMRAANDYSRQQVAELLRGLGPDAREGVPALVALAKDGPPLARVHAIRVLLRVSPDDLGGAGPALAELLKSPDRRAQMQAVQLLYEFGTRPPKTVIPALLEAVRSPDPSLRAMAGSALARAGEAGGPEVRAAFKQMLADKNPDVRLQAATLLDQAGAGEREAITNALIEVLGAKDVAFRLRVADVLRRQGEAGAKSALVALRAVLADGDPGQRLEAARQLLQPAPAPRGEAAVLAPVTAEDKAAAVAVINKVLTDGPTNRRPVALAALLTADPEHVSAARDGLVAAAADPDANIRLSAARVLTRIGPDGREQAVRLYADLAADRNEYIRMQAMTGLRELSPDAALAEVLTAQLLGDPATRLQAIQEVGRLSRVAAGQALPALRELLTDPTPLVRSQVAMALARVGDPADVEAAGKTLMTLAKDGPEGVRTVAVTALRKLGPPWADRAKPVVRTLLTAEQNSTRLAAARELLRDRAEDRRPIVPVVRELTRQGQPHERAQAAELLLQADPATAAEAVGILRQMLADRQARSHAAAALTKLGPEHDAALLPAARDLLRDPDRAARYAGVQLAHRFAPQLADLATNLAELMADFGTGGPAAAALAAMGEPGVKLLVAALDRPGPEGAAAVWGLQAAEAVGPTVVPKLIAMARSDDRTTRQNGESLLKRFKAEAVPALLKMLAGGAADDRRHAARLLGRLSPLDRATLSALEAATGDADAEVRRAAARAAYRGKSRTVAVVREVANAIRTGDETSRQEATSAVLGPGPIPELVAAALRAALADTSGPVRVAAASALQADPVSADAAAGVLIAAVRDPVLRVQALTVVTTPGPKPGRLRELIPDLKAVVANPPPGVYWHLTGQAVATLRAFDCPDLGRFLAGTVKSGRPQDIGSAHLAALRASGAEGMAVVRSLALTPAGAPLRSAALAELGRAAADDPSVVPVLVEQLHTAGDFGRSDELRAVGLAGPAGRAAGPALAALLADPDARRYAAVAIAQVGCPEGREEAYAELRTALRLAAGNRSTPTLAELVDAVGRFGPAAADAVQTLTPLLAGRDSFTRIKAAEALGRIGPPAARSAAALRSALTTDDVWLRSQAAVALWRVSGDGGRVVPVLAELLAEFADPQPDAVKSSRGGWVFVPESLAPAAWNGYDVRTMRRLMIQTLGEIGRPVTHVVPALELATRDWDPVVRAAAADALKRIRSAQPEGRP